MKQRRQSTVLRTMSAGLMILALGLGGCGSSSTAPSKAQPGEEPLDYANWDAVVEAARGTTVTHTGYGGDDGVNQWLTGIFAQTLKEKYEITLEFVPGMDFPTQLATEKQAGVGAGSYDTCWINGQLFRTMKENELLFGAYNHHLPNFAQYIDAGATDTNYDFTFPIEGHETPFSTAQLILIHDEAQTENPPKNARELLEFAKRYPGQVTYPSSEHFTGAAFIRTLIYDLCGHEQFMEMEADDETVREAVEPAMHFLRELNPYLWKEGSTFPGELGELDAMFASGEAVLTMSYGPYDVGSGISKGIYPGTTRPFLFDNGTVGNTSYYSIPFNAPNKAGALVVINEMLSAEMQAAKLDIAQEPTVLDWERLTPEERTSFDQADLGPNNLAMTELASKKLPEYSAAIEQMVTDIWLAEVVGRYNE